MLNASCIIAHHSSTVLLLRKEKVVKVVSRVSVESLISVCQNKILVALTGREKASPAKRKIVFSGILVTKSIH